MPATITITIKAESFEGFLDRMDSVRKDVYLCVQDGKGDGYTFTTEGDLEGEEEEDNHTFPFTVKGSITILGTYAEARQDACTFLEDMRLEEQDNTVMGYSIDDVKLED